MGLKVTLFPFTGLLMDMVEGVAAMDIIKMECIYIYIFAFSSGSTKKNDHNKQFPADFLEFDQTCKRPPPAPSQWYYLPWGHVY